MIYGVLFLCFVLIGVVHLDINQSVQEVNMVFIESDYELLVNRLYHEAGKRKVKKRYHITFWCFILGLLVFSDKDLITSLVYSMLLSCCVFKLHYVFIKEKYKQELKKAEFEFPYYLNALSMLVQNNPVPVALLKSIAMSPKIFEQDLILLVQELHEGKKSGAQPYLDFAYKFSQVKDLNRIMRSLFNLTVTSSANGKIMTSLTKLANEKVNLVRKGKFDKHLDKQALLPWLSFLWVGIVIIAMFSSMSINQLFT